MNNAVFISCKNPDAGKIICAIKEAEARLRNLGSELETNVGELEIGDDGVAITVSKKKFDDIQRELSECTEKIWNGYEKLSELRLVKFCQECEVPERTNNVVGGGMNQTQKMTIEYDKGYGHCTVKMTKIEVPKWGSGNGVGNTNIKKSQYELEEQKRIQEKNKKIAHYIGTIFLSVITAIIVTTAVLLYTR